MTDSVEVFNTVLRRSCSSRFSFPHHSKNLFCIGRELLEEERPVFWSKTKNLYHFPYYDLFDNRMYTMSVSLWRRTKYNGYIFTTRLSFVCFVWIDKASSLLWRSLTSTANYSSRAQLRVENRIQTWPSETIEIAYSTVSRVVRKSSSSSVQKTRSPEHRTPSSHRPR